MYSGSNVCVTLARGWCASVESGNILAEFVTGLLQICSPIELLHCYGWLLVYFILYK